MTTYIDALPKELRIELEYYRNNIYRIILNSIYRCYSISGDDRAELERIYLNHYMVPPILVNISYYSVFEEVQNLDHSKVYYYYQIPSTELITPSTFLNFYKRFRSTITIQEANRLFDVYKHPERLMEYNERI